ncbi:MAG: PASTA domain-containing protein [Ruminococcus sp.]|nr:PASTA domain-containing protein [Ruminococcus sp.]
MSLCIGCMHEIGSEIICPDCGFDNSRTQSAPFLPYGAVLNKRYVVGRNIETNGESTLYIGFDRQTSNTVLIREFLPAGYYTRAEGTVKVIPDASKAEDYERLFMEFEQFFSFLSTLRDMSAMNVITDIFRANNTCYVVEEYEELISFEEYVTRNNGHLEWEVARPLFMPVISLLEALHKHGYGHYAISPTNLYITTSGKALLLGFATADERRRGTSLKSQLFTGCAAPEQYENSFPLDNITDIYGFTATLFYALTGSLPAGAKERLSDGALFMSTSTVKRLPPHVVSALANGLQVKREDRIIDFGDLRSQLSVAPTVKAIQEEISRTASMAKTERPKKSNFGMSPISVGIIVTVVASLLFLWIGILIINRNTTTENPEPGQISTQTSVTETPTINNEEWTGETLKNYVGKNFEQVRAELSSKGIVAYKDAYTSSSDGYSDMYDEGVIMSQSFPEGTPLDADKGFAVTFKVSRGPNAATLPNVEDMSLASAVSKLTELGFVVYQDTSVVHSDKVAEGKVIGYKGHSAGDRIALESAVYLVVSAGPEKTN